MHDAEPILPLSKHTPSQTSATTTISSIDTKYLDGLRGLAALLVYTHHHTWRAHTLDNGPAIFTSAFGQDDEYYLSTFPWIRLLFSGGPAAVAVFFVISGHVLALKPLAASHSGSPETLLRVLGSGTFRRLIRLFLPVAVTTLAWALSWHVLDLMPASRAEGVVGEIGRWARNFARYSFVFKDVENEYNGHLWAVAFEFRGTMVVFAAILALRHLRNVWRVMGEAALVAYFLWIVDGPYYACFVGGLLICDLRLLSVDRKRTEPWLTRVLSRCEKIFGPWTAFCVFVLALYLGGVPTRGGALGLLQSSPGWALLSYMAPSNFGVFYQFWCAVLLIVSIPHLYYVKYFLESSICQYLGRISFSLYLVHGPIMSSIGDRLYAISGRLPPSEANVPSQWFMSPPTERSGWFGMELDFVQAHVILLPCTIFAAEFCTRAVDWNADRLSRWLFRVGAADGRHAYR